VTSPRLETSLHLCTSLHLPAPLLLAMASDLACTVCGKTFRNEKMMFAHSKYSSCKKENIDNLEKAFSKSLENVDLESAIVIEDEDDTKSTPAPKTKVDIKNIKRLSVEMLDQLKMFNEEKDEAKVVELSDEKFSQLRSTLSKESNTGRLGPQVPVFKPPLPVARRKKGRMLTCKPCYFCASELADNISLALHMVREHWEAVRARHRGGGPKSKFHLSGASMLPSTEQRLPLALPQHSATASRHLQGLQGADQALQRSMGTATPSLTPAWMNKLDGRSQGYAEKMARYKGKLSSKNCSICGAIFKTLDAVFRHKSSVHGTMGSVPARGRPNLATSEACEVCDDDFNWPDVNHVCPRTLAKKMGGNTQILAKTLPKILPKASPKILPRMAPKAYPGMAPKILPRLAPRIQPKMGSLWADSAGPILIED